MLGIIVSLWKMIRAVLVKSGACSAAWGWHGPTSCAVPPAPISKKNIKKYGAM